MLIDLYLRIDDDDNITIAIVFQNRGHLPAYNVSLTIELSEHIYIPFNHSRFCVRFGNKGRIILLLLLSLFFDINNFIKKPLRMKPIGKRI